MIEGKEEVNQQALKEEEEKGIVGIEEVRVVGIKENLEVGNLLRVDLKTAIAEGEVEESNYFLTPGIKSFK